MKALKVFNSLSRKKEKFKPGPKNKVGLYVCGITPYDVTHLGHAFTYVVFDVVVRYLRYLGYKVTYVQNLTDIDDDILKKAKELKENWRAVVKKNTQLFLADMKWLNNLPPDVFPRATDHIREIIKFIKVIFRRGLAYEKNGNVYFSIEKDKQYGRLSKLSKKRMLPISVERGNDPKDPNKKNPLDFVLWQKKKRGEPAWDSPWSKGRPGWHIECSVMAQKYLGKTIDIHGGGEDLIFPHHESSLAQSEAVTGQKFIRYWLHTGMLRYQSRKMSKSLGNMIFISGFKKKYRPNTIRLFLLSHHYRSAWEYFEKDIKRARELNELFKRVWNVPSGSDSRLNVSREEKAFLEAMNDDFNTPKAIKVLERLAKRITKVRGKSLAEAKFLLNRAFNVLGLQIEYE